MADRGGKNGGSAWALGLPVALFAVLVAINNGLGVVRTGRQIMSDVSRLADILGPSDSVYAGIAGILVAVVLLAVHRKAEKVRGIYVLALIVSILLAVAAAHQLAHTHSLAAPKTFAERRYRRRRKHAPIREASTHPSANRQSLEPAHVSPASYTSPAEQSSPTGRSSPAATMASTYQRGGSGTPSDSSASTTEPSSEKGAEPKESPEASYQTYQKASTNVSASSPEGTATASASSESSMTTSPGSVDITGPGGSISVTSGEVHIEGPDGSITANSSGTSTSG
jgi:hypothetical protein